ncbi:MAG: TetR/AcrR family transcriptional regulator [Solirubrobacterales bacterium]
MIATPWGESEELRERRLPPGPGTPREKVERNQRERLYGAMVACVAKKGYEGTTVAELTEIAGVSSRTFYDLFGDKKGCFLATLEAMIGAAVAYAAKRDEEAAARKQRAGGKRTAPLEEENWEVQARRGFDSFAEIVVLQPAAARMALVETFAAGPEALAPLQAAARGFEWLTRQTLAQSPERAGMPDEMITAHVGAMREITSTRLREGREAELPKLMGELWELMISYRPPPHTLRLTGRVAKTGPEESLEAHDHAERALRAFAIVAAEKGYAATTVDEVVKRAGMSATTFYANFRGKEDAMMAAIDSAGAQMVAVVVPVFRRAPDWPHAMRAGFGALFSFLASRPALARLVIMEAYAAGPAALARRSEALASLRGLIEIGYERSPAAAPIATEVITGGIYTLAYRKIQSEGPAALPHLAPICAYIALSPFIGPEEACEVANGVGRGE